MRILLPEVLIRHQSETEALSHRLLTAKSLPTERSSDKVADKGELRMTMGREKEK